MLKKHLIGNLLVTDANMKHAVISRLQTLDKDFFCARIQALAALLPWGDKHSNVSDD
jgi:hypothetical protein